MTEQNPLAGFNQLIENRYDLHVLDSHYILVDKKFQQYNMMLHLQLNKQMEEKFMELYKYENSAMHVVWEIQKDNSIKFYAQMGNNILLLLDTFQK